MKTITNKYLISGKGIIIENQLDTLDYLFMDNRFTDKIDNATHIKNCYIHGFTGDTTDGLQLNGNLCGIAEHVRIDNSSLASDAGDECASIVNGADFLFVNCLFSNNGKGVLQGSGDSNIADIRNGTRSIFYNCVFLNNSRRNPFIQSGNSLIIECLIANWGRSFHEKSFGIRAGKNAQVTVIDSVFVQDSLGECIKRGHTLKDTFGHYFWPFWIGPGFRRAAYADWGGQIVCYNCYKNRNWLYLKNHRGKYMDKDEASAIVNKLKNKVYPELENIKL